MEIVTAKIKKSLTTKKVPTIVLIITFAIFSFFSLAPNLAKAFSYTILRELAKQQFLFKTRHLLQIEGNHFIVRYYPKDENVAKMVLENAESVSEPVIDMLGYRPKGKVPVIIYPSREALGQSFGWEANESAMGVYWAGAIRILSPNEWIDETDKQQVKETFENSGPMAHEFSHLVIDYYTRGNYTRWFTEGIAQYIEYELTGFAFNEKGSKLDQPLYPFETMDQDYDSLGNQGLAYRQSLMAVKYLQEGYGQEKLLSILGELRKGRKLNDSMRETIGVDLQQFESDFTHWVKLNLSRIESDN